MTAFNSTSRMWLILCSLGFISAAALAADLKQGTITEMDSGKIVLMMPGEQMNFTVSSSTLISLDGRAATTADLKVGDTAAVTYVIQDDSSPIAQRIDAMRPTTPGAPDPAPRH